MRNLDWAGPRAGLQNPRPAKYVPEAESLRRTSFRREMRELGAVWAGMLLIMVGTLAILCVLALLGSISR
jgi:hypothetical protein